MRAPLFALMILLTVNLLIDWYIWHQAKNRCHSGIWSRIQLYSAVFLTLSMIAEMILPARRGGDSTLLGKMWLLFAYLSVYLPKYIAVAFDLIGSIPRLWKKHRIKFLTKTGIALGIVVFGAFWWGAAINRFRIQVKEVTVGIDGLPASFDGFTIAQFSDLHTGTFMNDTTFVHKLVTRINRLHPDVIVFTGDIVNRESSEMLPFVETLSRLHAPEGVYAILGNHDYGDYRHWRSPSDKRRNMEMLFDAFSRTGIRLLCNTTQWLHTPSDSIALIGVENIGDPPFRTYGSLHASYPALGDSITKVLLSHNPQHWADSICGNRDMNIALTLSGHTHAMQIELADISPAAMRYKTWGGLYADADSTHQLYVNIGAGTVGLPARIGATPEVTLITLRRR